MTSCIFFLVCGRSSVLVKMLHLVLKMNVDIICVMVFSLGMVLAREKDIVKFHGYTLYRVFPDSEEKIDILESMSEENDDNDVDFWNFPASTDEHGEILVAPGTKKKFEKELRAANIHFIITREDIQGAIDEEHVVDPSKSRKRVFTDGFTFDVSKYNTWEDIETYLRRLPTYYPSLASVRIIGSSHEGRDLVVVKVGTKKRGQKKPAIWMDSTIHAREWITLGTSLYILDSILYSYKGSKSIRRYLDEIDWYFLPVLNPDGYVHSYQKNRMWRKNRSPNNCTLGKRCCMGVDLNRNYGYQWGGNGASSGHCSNQYAGPEPFSEPETRAVRDFVMKRADHIKAFLTYHTPAKSWRHPFSYKRNTYPEDVEELKTLATYAVTNLASLYNVKYNVGRGRKALSGVARDWAKAEAKVKFVYTVELASRGSGFVAPIRSIIPSGEENWAALTVVADTIIEKYVNETNATGTTEAHFHSTVSHVMKTTKTTPRLSSTTKAHGTARTNATTKSHTTPTVGSTTKTTPKVGPTITKSTPKISTRTTARANATAKTTTPSPVGGGHANHTESSCVDITGACAEHYNLTDCKVDTLIRAMCQKYCGEC